MSPGQSLTSLHGVQIADGEGFFFDFDETLVDTEQAAAKAWRRNTLLSGQLPARWLAAFPESP